MTIDAPTVVVLELSLDRLEDLPATLRDIAFLSGGDRYGPGRHEIASSRDAAARWKARVTIQHQRKVAP